MFDNDDLFDFAPDMDFDGDSDLQDALFLEDILEEEEKLTTARHTMTPERFHVKNADEEDILFEYGIDPDDYIIRAEYEEAVFEAKYGWRKNVEDGWDYGLDPEDFETEEEYLKALESAIENEENSSEKMEIRIPIKISFEWGRSCDNEENQNDKPKTGIEIRKKSAEDYLNFAKGSGDDDTEMIDRCEFIVNSGQEAAKYLTPSGIFLYSQAIRDNFEIHFEIEEEIDSVKLHFITFLTRMARHDMSRAITIWEWCLHTFMPYIQYADHDTDLTSGVLVSLGNFPDNIPKVIVSYMVSNPMFIQDLLTSIDTSINVDTLIETALEDEHIETAKAIMECIVSNPRLDVYDKENLIQSCIDSLSYRKDLEPMELFQKYIFPVAINDADEYITFCIPEWEEQMREHIEYVEENNEEYAYSRRFAWRAKYRDNDIDSTDYETEEEYLNIVYERKYGWRKYCSNRFGIDPANFETRNEYDAAINAEYAKEREARTKARDADPINMDVYHFCKVRVSEYYDAPYYYYFTGDLQLDVGDYVMVPFGRDNSPTKARVMSVGNCYGCAFPCHVSKIKTVEKKLEREE